MIDLFKDEYFWMRREVKGYFPWLNNSPHRLVRHLRWIHHEKCLMCNDGYQITRELIRLMTEENVCENPLLDLIMKALIRAEVRFISRFVPQNSHEERLTGNLVSEMDNAIFLIRKSFLEISFELYSEEKDVDYFYYDLSRGGKIEKSTGADLGLIIVLDLPDFPFNVKSLIFQAKKITGNTTQINRDQYETLKNHGVDGCAYLFYDMLLSRRCSPLVVGIEKYNIKNRYEDCVKKNNKSFSYEFDDARSDGHPLSLFLMSHLVFDKSIGRQHHSFKDAFNMFSGLSRGDNKSKTHFADDDFNGRLAILSIGRKIRFSTPNNEILDIDV